MSITSLIKEVQQGKSAGPITRAMANWDKKITPEAVETVNRLRLKDLEASRSSGEGRFRGSLLGSCPRMQMLSYRGYVANQPVGDSLEIMRDGTYRHYFWQEVGLSAGFLTEIEHWAEHEPWHFGGQLDGLMAADPVYGDRGGFELKTMNERSFAKAMKEGSVSEKHLKQIGAYCEAANLDWFSVVYETRSFKVQWKEFVVQYDDTLKDLIRTSVESLLDYERNETLPPVKEGYPKDNECSLWCQYTAICPSAVW